VAKASLCFVEFYPVKQYIFPDIVNHTLDNRAVKTNITLPAWLRDWAGTQEINLSQTLQATLNQMYNARR
jgi:hypothetical protein